MNKLAFLRRFAFAVILVLSGVNLWGQEPTLTGAGTAENPYEIGSSTDWANFAYWISNGNNADKYYKLTANIQSGAGVSNDVSTNGIMVGTKTHPFSGIFDGDGYNLVFYYKHEGDDADTIAPFKYTNNATINNLNVSGGLVKSESYGVAGLIGCNLGEETTTVNNVTVGISIYSEGEYSGGFAVYGSNVTFTDCIYNGSFGSYGWYAGGFCGYGDKTTKLNGCLYNPSSSTFWGENFVYTEDYDFDPESNLINCYYTKGDHEGDSSQGVYVYTEIPDDNIAEKLNTINGVDVYDRNLITVEININTDVPGEYNYTGDEIAVVFNVTFNGLHAVEGGDYTYTITDHYGGSFVQDIGEYTLTVTGVPDYYGSKTATFSVTSNLYGKWQWLKNKIEDPSGPSSITLDSNYVAGTGFGDGTIIINRAITIDLNGFTINRNLSEATEDGQVIRINSGKNVEIKGPGIITGAWNKAKGTTGGSADNDGGCIYNKGNLKLDKVTVSNNKCEKKDSGTSATARGGGIYSGKNSSLTMINTIVRENSAQGGGGGIFADQATSFSMSDNCIVKSNISKDKGGGIRVNNCGTAAITDSNISSNILTNSSSTSAANGGGIHNDAGTLTLENCIINTNIASKFGGGIYVLKGRVTTKGCTINHNQSYDENKLFNSRGGGVYIYSGTFEMDGGTIYDNSSNLAYGGGVFVNNYATDNSNLTYFKVKGDVKIYGNWRFYDDEHYETTNVYLTGKTANDCITITGDLEDSRIGVAKNGRLGVFTKGLGENGGEETNFTSDDSGYVISIKDGEALFEKPNPWVPEPDPSNPGEYIINNTVIIDKEYTDITKITLGDNGKIVIVDGGYLETTIENSDVNKLIIYGGQFVPTNSGVMATMKKDISYALALSNKNWYLISSGIANPGLVGNTNLLRMADEYPQYDLYRFNEAASLQWENYRNQEHPDFTTLQNGRGYLYRNANDYTINIRGTLNTSNVSYTLSYTDTEGNLFKGINIIGNPYSHNITKGNSNANILNGDLLKEKYYVLDAEDGSFDVTDDGTEIPPMTGILVQAKKAGTLTTTYAVPESKAEKSKPNNNIWFSVANNKYDDKACVEFKEGHGLNKIAHLNEKAPMLYIHHNGEDFASVDMNPEAKQVELYFEAKTMDQYTLSVKPQGDYSYLHLIDKVAERDIDLLEESEYTFIGSTSDNADRFVVRLNNSENAENPVFAYQSGSNIVVCGEGELQVFDVMGRLVAQKRVNGVESIEKPQTAGVYILRLNENTQKIIIK